MGLLLFFKGTTVAPHLRAGSLSPAATLSGADATTYVRAGTLAADTSVSGERNATVPVVLTKPSVVYEVAFSSPPLTVNPAWNDLSVRLRDAGGLKTTRGRAYEYDRTETGTAQAQLSNRDAALSPANTSSPFNPLKSTRPVRARLQYDQTYPLFYGISEGYPQAYPSYGKDALVELAAADLFYALNRARFTPGSTTLQADLALFDETTTPQAVITVASTAFPMPEVVPFVALLDEGTENQEKVTVTEITSATQYTIERSLEGSHAHSVGAQLTTEVVSFAAELSGSRISRVLSAVGFSTQWQDLDTGQTEMAATKDLASVAPLEHINLITAAEFGRFFVSRAGKFTFRDRHSVILDFLDPVMTFRNLPATGTNVPFRIEGALEHSEDKLYNRVRITIPSGEIVDIKDDASIADHFERVFEREWPYEHVVNFQLTEADPNEYWILGLAGYSELGVTTWVGF